MNIKNELLQLCDIQKEVKELTLKIEKLKDELKIYSVDKVKGSSQYFPYLEKTFYVQGIDLKIQAKIELYTYKLQEKYNNLLEKQLKLEDFIENIKDSRMRRIFRYRYIEQCSWVKTASMVSASATAESVRKEHDRFLEKI